MLPPNFESKHPYLYGTLTLTVSSLELPHQYISSLQPHFFGRGRSQIRSFGSSSSLTFEYNIATNLWHFYSYLTDCRTISLILTTQNKQVYTSEMHLKLLPSGQVLNRFNPSIDYLFQGNSYLLNKKENISVFDKSNKKVGNLQVELELSFNKEIHQILYDNNLVNFQDILVIDEISPIPSSVDFQQSIFEDEVKKTDPFSSGKLNILESEINNLRQTHKQLNLPVRTKQEQDIEEDEKRIEDDIDRLIAEMQSKPYDSSRYLQTNKEEEHPFPKENQNYQNYSIKRQSAEKISSCQRMPPKPPGSTRVTASPQKYFQPILSYTVGTPQEFPNRTNYLMNATTLNQSSYTQKSNSRERFKANQPKNGLIKLKIHQLVMQRLQPQLSLLLKVYINDESTEYYSANSVKQGEALIFNSHLKIQDKNNVEQMRFQLIDTFDLKTIYASGIFDMRRLYDQSPCKGIFMVNMISPQIRPDSASKTIRVSESQVSRVIPNAKSLRIEVQYEDPIEIVQIYFSLSDFSQLCKVCRYKIPMTKETIEFRVYDLAKNKHVNIFPHNRSSSSSSSQTIIVELWAQTELIGFSQVSLKPLYNTNQKMINCSLDPISLYNEIRQIRDFKGAQTKASFKLDLSYGTISQVQSLLNRNPQRQTRPQVSKKEVEVESHLGIYLKENKQKKEVEIQVDDALIEEKSSQCLSRKTTMNLLQQQQLPEDDQDDDFQADVSMKTEENQFLNKTIQEKYLNKETMPIITCQPVKTKEECLSRTIKVKGNLDSLTKQFQSLIKQCLSCFSNEQLFLKLKNQCQQHLLYNFIDRGILADILEGLGLQSTSIDTILTQVLSHSNDMTNINMLYDLIYGLLLEGQIKEKYIDDCQMGRYCLSCFVQKQQEQDMTQEAQIQFDEDTDFDEGKNIFQKIGFKLTMRQFNQIEKYLSKLKQENPKIQWSQIKNILLERQCQKAAKEEQKNEYEKAVEGQLYNNYQWDDEDDFFISNINRPQKDASQNPTATQNLSKESYKSVEDSNIIESQLKYNYFIENKSPLQDKKELKKPQRSPANKPFHILTIQGFQNCIEAAQCHLDIKITSPQLRVTYKSVSGETEIKLMREETKRVYQIEVFLSQTQQYLDGCIQLVNSSKIVAKCNFSIIKNVRSIYTLKSTPDAQFCGLIYLQFSDK